MPSLMPHDTTHTHTCRWRRWKVFSAFIPSWHHPPPGTARSSGRPAMRRPGTKSKCSVLTWSGSGPTSICSFCMFLLLGFYGGNPGNTGRTCKLHTERPWNKPRHVAPCGTWTHDLLAVRQQCYALCHRAWRAHYLAVINYWSIHCIAHNIKTILQVQASSILKQWWKDYRIA